MKYDIIYITNLPSFYKINLFNRLAIDKRLLVVFTNDTSSKRNNDFYNGDRKFEFESIANKSFLGKIFFVINLLFSTSYQNLILGGWDQTILWLAAFVSSRNKNSIVVESSIHESKTQGLKGFVKKLFLLRIYKAYCSGSAQSEILYQLDFKGKIIITKGVGIFNIVNQPPYVAFEKVTNFIYVGRFSPEKNLVFLVENFNKLPHFNLHLVGYGVDEKKLKQIASKNIIFHGAIENLKLSEVFQTMDVFILPSSTEPWGLVVEEALNNGLPVIVSNKVGCADEIVSDEVGLIFIYDKEMSLLEAIEKISNPVFYNQLRFNIAALDFDEVMAQQVKCYF